MAVTLYCAPWCEYCSKAKLLLKKLKIDFREKNVEDDRRAAEEMVRKSGQSGVPVLDINGHIVIGYDPKAIERALKSATGTAQVGPVCIK
jgi:glutaredoxin-like YruB-family protein